MRAKVDSLLVAGSQLYHESQPKIAILVAENEQKLITPDSWS